MQALEKELQDKEAQMTELGDDSLAEVEEKCTQLQSQVSELQRQKNELETIVQELQRQNTKASAQ